MWYHYYVGWWQPALCKAQLRDMPQFRSRLIAFCWYVQWHFCAQASLLTMWPFNTFNPVVQFITFYLRPTSPMALESTGCGGITPQWGSSGNISLYCPGNTIAEMRGSILTSPPVVFPLLSNTCAERLLCLPKPFLSLSFPWREEEVNQPLPCSVSPSLWRSWYFFQICEDLVTPIRLELRSYKRNCC